MNEMIRVLIVEPHKPPREAEIPNTLEAQQAVVQGYIEYVYDGDCILVINEEGKINGMEGNRRIPGDVLVGPFFIAGDGGDDLCSLTGRQVEAYSARFAQPEDISQDEIEAHTGMRFFCF